MLLTRPSFTGSWLAMKTMGIVVVAALAAKGPRVHRGRATELNSRPFAVLCAEAALNAASTFHRSAVVDRVNIKSMSLHGLCRLYGTSRTRLACRSVSAYSGVKRTGPQHMERLRKIGLSTECRPAPVFAR